MLTSETEFTNTIDWFSFTCDSPQYHEKSTMLCTELDRGMYGYSGGVKFVDGRLELINPDRPDMRVHVQYNGSSLLENHLCGVSAWEIVSIRSSGEKIARIDLAIDIKKGALDIVGLAEMVKAGQLVSQARKSMFISSLDAPGATLYIGSPSSDQRLRIYDKAAEQGMAGIEWTRIELQLRGKRSHIARSMLLTNGGFGFIPTLVRSFADFPQSAEYAVSVGHSSRAIGAPKRSGSDTRKWLETTVVSSLAKEVVKPGGADFLRDFLARVQGQIAFESEKIKGRGRPN